MGSVLVRDGDLQAVTAGHLVESSLVVFDLVDVRDHLVDPDLSKHLQRPAQFLERL